MSNFEKLKKQTRLVFAEENPEETKEQIIQKEQNALNDFIAGLDKEVYEDLSKFPLKYPKKITYPDSIKLDDFIILSVKDEFYLFPKMLEEKLSDYIELKKYFTETSLPRFHFKKILTPLNKDKREEYFTEYEKNFYFWEFIWIAVIMSAIICMLVSTLVAFISLGVIFVTTFVTMFFGERMSQLKAEIKYINNEEKFNKILPKLKTLNFPLEFFDKNLNDIIIYP